MPNESDRRRYRRVQAPVFCRPLGQPLFGKTQPIDISQGGLRIYADDELAAGSRLELELFLPDDTSVVCEVEIVWVEALPPSAPARFDMGLKYLDPTDARLERLAMVLEGGATTKP
jgi:hypothetical protein